MKLVVIALALLAVAGCASLAKQIIQEPKVSLAHVSIGDVGLKGATLLVGVQVENPNPFKLKVDALRYDVEIGGKLLSHSELPQAAEVDGHATKVVEIPVPVKFEDLFSSVIDFMSKSSTNYRIHGDARLGLLTVPFDQSGDLKLK